MTSQALRSADPPTERVGKATIREVARASGYSTATVSRALHGHPSVSGATREWVTATAERMSYAPSVAASKLASGRLWLVALIATTDELAAVAPAIAAAQRALAAQNFDLVLQTVEGHATAVSRIANRLRGRVDAALVASTLADPYPADIAQRLGRPFGFIGPHPDGHSSVDVDADAAGRLAADHLLALGHRRFAVMSADGMGAQAEARRAAAFEQALRGTGTATEIVRVSAGDVVRADQAMADVLVRPDRPTAVFATNDDSAAGALHALLRHRLQPGGDVSIVGYGSGVCAEHLDLTRVLPPIADLGRLAASMLLAKLDDVAYLPAPVLVTPKLVARSSTGPAPCQ